MTPTTPAPAALPVSTGGAWLGLGIAARAALCVASAAMTFVTASGIELMVDGVTSIVDADERTPQIDRLFDIWLDGAAVIRPYARIVGATGVLAGLALFVAAALVVRGNEMARRASRVLLVVDALHSLAAGAWLVVLCLTKLAEWNLRYQAVLVEIVEIGGDRDRIRAWTEIGDRLNAAFYGGWAVASAAVALLLGWFAGRPFVRDWCAARSGISPVDARPGPR
jgi:hypothetical protein